jgi:hypothetical protein
VPLPLFAATGDEIIGALRRGGFALASLTKDRAVLERAYDRVTVPRTHLLEPEELLAVLRAANVTYAELIELLDGAPDEELAPTAPPRPIDVPAAPPSAPPPPASRRAPAAPPPARRRGRRRR